MIAVCAAIACNDGDKPAPDLGPTPGDGASDLARDQAITPGTKALGELCGRTAECLPELVCFKLPNADRGFCTRTCKVVDQPCDLEWSGLDLCLDGRGDDHCVQICWLKGTGTSGKSYPCAGELRCEQSLGEDRKICVP